MATLLLANQHMEVISLQSGSNGNSFYVKAGDREFLFDAGINGSVAERRLAQHGKDIRTVEGLFISHGHRDHCRAMGIYHRKYGHPVFVTTPTLAQARRDHNLGTITDLHIFQSGDSLDFGDVQIHTVKTPHDADDSVAFIIEHQDRRIGILTDIGHAFKGLAEILSQLDAVVIESNYDPKMIQTSRYPIWLKRRVQGPGGHLSNDDAAVAIRDSGIHHLQWICLCHLSEENNHPDIAVQTHRRVLGEELPIHVASRYDVGDVMTLSYDGPTRGPWKYKSGAKTEKQLSLFQ